MADEHRVLIAQAIVTIDDPKATAGDVLDALHALSKERAQLFIDLTDPPTPARYELGGLVGEGLDADSAALSLGKEYRAPLAELAALKDLPPALDIAVEARAAIDLAAVAAERAEPVVAQPADVNTPAAAVPADEPPAKES